MVDVEILCEARHKVRVLDEPDGAIPEQDVHAWGVSLYAEVQPWDDWTLRSITAYRRDRSNNVVRLGAEEAFRRLSRQPCAQCWCARVVEENYAWGGRFEQSLPMSPDGGDEANEVAALRSDLLPAKSLVRTNGAKRSP